MIVIAVAVVVIVVGVGVVIGIAVATAVECCCILIIYYCWQASSATLPSRARRMTSFVKIFRSVGVERVAPRWVLLLLALFFIFGTFFSMRRRGV